MFQVHWQCQGLINVSQALSERIGTYAWIWRDAPARSASLAVVTIILDWATVMAASMTIYFLLSGR